MSDHEPTPEELWALGRRVIGARPHELVDVLLTAPDLDSAVAEVGRRFGLSLTEAGIILDQQFRLILKTRPGA